MMSLASLFVVIPVSLLLALSFFVLVTVRKVEGNALKTFGQVVVSLLWLAALILFLGSFQMPGRMIRGPMHQKAKMGGNMPMIMQREQVNLPSDNASLAKPGAKAGKPCGGNRGIVFKAD
jgi:energy-coupling factor transporter transmembrane protein EcfT